MTTGWKQSVTSDQREGARLQLVIYEDDLAELRRAKEELKQRLERVERSLTRLERQRDLRQAAFSDQEHDAPQAQ